MVDKGHSLIIRNCMKMQKCNLFDVNMNNVRLWLYVVDFVVGMVRVYYSLVLDLEMEQCGLV